MTSKTLRAVAVGVVVALSVILVTRVAGRQDDIARLAKISRTLPARSSEARPAEELPYRRLASATRMSSGPDPSASHLQLLSEAAKIEVRARREPTPRNLVALGVAQLMLGNPHVTINTLQRALLQETSIPSPVEAICHSRNPALLTALSAAYYERARREAAPSDHGAAFECAEHAWRLQKTPTTAWNRALTLQALHCQSRSREAWQDYLSLDGESDWAKEARDHLRKLQAPQGVTGWADARLQLLVALADDDRNAIREIIGRFPQAARTMVEEELLAAWAEAAAAQDRSTADLRWRDAVRVISVLRETTGDHLLSAFVRSVASARDVAAIAEGYRAQSTGRAQYRERRILDARRLLEHAEKTFSGVDSPVIHVTRVYRAAVLYYENRYADVVTYTAAATTAACRDELSYHSACALSEWMLALGLVQLGRPEEALDAFTRAHTRFMRVGETENAAAVAQLRAETLTHLGSPYDAWEDRRRAMAIYGQLPVARRPVAWIDWARSFLTSGAPQAAIAILSEVAEDALCRSDEMMAADALSWRALALSRVNATALAAADLELAAQMVASITDNGIKQRADANLALVRAEIMATRGSISATDLQRAESFFNRDETGFLSPSVHLLRAKARVRNGEDIAAAEDLRQGIVSFERQRRTVDDPFLLGIFTQRGQALFEQCALLSIRLRRFDEAWRCSERYREVASEPNHSAVADYGSVPSLQEVMAALPEDVTLVQQDLIDNTLITWIIRRNRYSLEAQRMTPAVLYSAVGQLRDSLQHDSNSLRVVASAKQLYELLLGSAATEITSKGRLIYLPSGSLRQVPVGALHDGQSFLVRRQPVASARSVLAVLAHLRTAPAAQRQVMLVGEPGQGRTDESSLAAVWREIDDIAALHGPRATVYGGQSKKLILAHLANYDLIHFAGHGRRGDGPFRSALLLGTTDTLYAFEILRRPLHRRPVVVLAACNTVDESVSPAFAVSPGSAFLTAGAAAVVGSLWPAGDAPTRDLLVRFHREYAHRSDAMVALHEAQRSIMSEGRPARDWSAFQVWI